MHVGLKIFFVAQVLMWFAFLVTRQAVKDLSKSEVDAIKENPEYRLLVKLFTVGFYSTPVGLIIWIVWR